MKRLALLLAALVWITSAEARERIGDDAGGSIKAYVERFESWRNSDQLVEVDGWCMSACTLVLGFVPPSRLCVTEKAVFGFHAAFARFPDGVRESNSIGTQTLWELYPPHIQKWITEHGGLKEKFIFLDSEELRSMYRLCEPEKMPAPR
jgi:hypothetical protein